jgi:hypothetical protein
MVGQTTPLGCAILFFFFFFFFLSFDFKEMVVL